MPQKGKKNFNVNVDLEIAESFDEQTAAKGYTKYRAVEGALRLWLTSSPEQQVKVMNGLSITPPETDRVRRIVELLEEFRRLTLGPAEAPQPKETSSNDDFGVAVQK